MNDDDRDLRRAVQQLANDTLQDTLANVRHHSEVRRLVARGDLSDQELAVAYSDYVQQSGPEYRRTVADLTVRYYAALADLANDYSRRFYEQVVSGLAPPTDDRVPWSVRPEAPNGEAAGSRSPTTPAARVPMELHAAAGHVATGAFSLDNRRDEAVTVSFEVSSWRGSDGRVFDNPVVLVPEWVQLPANGRADVTVSVRLRPELYAPDHLYTATVAVRGHDGLTVLLNAWVEPVIDVEPVTDEAPLAPVIDEASSPDATGPVAAPDTEPPPAGLPIVPSTKPSGAKAASSKAAKPGASSSGPRTTKRAAPAKPAGGRRSSGADGRS